jgi:hypothetical protein
VPNQIGQAYTFMALTAILPGRSGELREYVESLPAGPESPFARVKQVHFARWVIIPQLVEVGPPPERPDRLKNEYLLFSSDFDGRLDRFLDAMIDAIGEETDAVYRHCVGFPGTGARDGFHRYMRHNQIDTTFPFSAYPDATVAEVREALALRERLIAFAVRTQSLDPDALLQEYRREFAPAG